jgi:hypothetical protein
LNELDAEDRMRFEQLVLPRVDNAFNLARWLLRRREDAEDVAQEASLRACRFLLPNWPRTRKQRRRKTYSYFLLPEPTESKFVGINTRAARFERV